MGVKADFDVCDSVGVSAGFEGAENTSRITGTPAGCEKGFTGPRGPSENDGATAVDGVGRDGC